MAKRQEMLRAVAESERWLESSLTGHHAEVEFENTCMISKGLLELMEEKGRVHVLSHKDCLKQIFHHLHPTTATCDVNCSSVNARSTLLETIF